MLTDYLPPCSQVVGHRCFPLTTAPCLSPSPDSLVPTGAQVIRRLAVPGDLCAPLQVGWGWVGALVSKQTTRWRITSRSFKQQPLRLLFTDAVALHLMFAPGTAPRRSVPPPSRASAAGCACTPGPSSPTRQADGLKNCKQTILLQWINGVAGRPNFVAQPCMSAMIGGW